MGKKVVRVALATLAVGVACALMDMVLHGLILGPSYAATAQLWRPEPEMKMVLMEVVTLLTSFTFVMVYARFFARKSIAAGLEYGLWFGLGAALAMGYGTYAVMPIPYHMALVWFLGTLAESLVAGLLVGLIVRD